MVNFTEAVNASIEWTTTVLFRPFNFKKWLILGFVALLSGYNMSGGNLGGNFTREKVKEAQAQEVSQASPPVSERQCPLSLKGILSRNFPWLNRLTITLIILAILILIIIFSWLYSHFAFIFLEDVVKNDASIKIPFQANRELSNSLFLFSLSFGAIFLVMLGLLVFICFQALAREGVFSNTGVIGFKQIFFTLLPFGLCAALVIFITIIITVMNNDFVLVVMFRDRLKIMQAWSKVLAVFSTNRSALVKYLFIKLGLVICCYFMSLLYIAAFIGLLLPVGISSALLFLIYRSLPSALHLAYFIILGTIATPILFFLFYCLMCLSLPFTVFYAPSV
jgi:hypothetical protein